MIEFITVRVKIGMSLWNGMWHGLRIDIIIRNVIYENGAKKLLKLNRKAYARICHAYFWQATAQIWRRNRFAGPFITGSSTNKAEQHVVVHEDYGGNYF